MMTLGTYGALGKATVPPAEAGCAAAFAGRSGPAQQHLSLVRRTA